MRRVREIYGEVGDRSATADATRIALVHDWLTGMRGGEKALEVLCERFPDAELFTLVHVRGSVSPAIERLRTHTSFVQRLPLRRSASTATTCRSSRPRSSSSTSIASIWSSASATAARSRSSSPAACRHLCYCLTPMRYAWDQFDAYFGPERLGRAGSALMRPVMARLARWDRDTADRADRYVAISHYVAGRIRRYYNREATVVYPPVDTDFFHPDAAPARAFRARGFGTGPLQTHRRGDRRLPPGRRAAEDRRRRPRARGARARGGVAGADVRFLGRLSDEEIRDAVPARRGRRCCPATRTSASCRSRRRRADVRWSRSGAAARSRRSCRAKPASSSTS